MFWNVDFNAFVLEIVTSLTQTFRAVFTMVERVWGGTPSRCDTTKWTHYQINKLVAPCSLEFSGVTYSIICHWARGGSKYSIVQTIQPVKFRQNVWKPQTREGQRMAWSLSPKRCFLCEWFCVSDRCQIIRSRTAVLHRPLPSPADSESKNRDAKKNSVDSTNVEEPGACVIMITPANLTDQGVLPT